MATINKINVEGQDYDISVPDGSSLSLSSLTVTGDLTVSGTSNLSDATCRIVNAIGVNADVGTFSLNLNAGSAHLASISADTAEIGILSAAIADLSVVNCSSITTSNLSTTSTASLHGPVELGVGIYGGASNGLIRFISDKTMPSRGLRLTPLSTTSTNKTWILANMPASLTLGIEGSVDAAGDVSCSALSTTSITVDGAPSRIGLRGQSSYDSFIEYDNTEDALSLGFTNAGETTWNMYINHAGTSGNIDLNGGSLNGASTIRTSAIRGNPLTLSIGSATFTYSYFTYNASVASGSFVTRAAVEGSTNTTLSINNNSAASQLTITNNENKVIKIIPSATTQV